MTAKALCLNMIVKNEMANLERCLSSVVDHIACWVIGDTGSTDGTQDFIRSFFAARNIPGELHSFPFHNFEQARNAALDCAYASPLAYDYVLFDDADMELVVEDRDFRKKLAAPSYTVLQRSGIMYWNTRLVQRGAGARYRGVTHEYVDVPGGGGEQLHGIWYKDHASGANRVDKFARDIRLLTEALEKEPDNHRYWFYLAQSYRDAGETAKAAETYAKRAAMGGWDEEAWYARLQEARCLRQLGDEGGFLRQALAAFNQRPHRAEPLYDLARFYREKRMNEASALFAEAGLPIPRPKQDILFLEDFVYNAGLKEEYSIAANYARDPLRKDRGFAACNWLALSRTAPAHNRHLAISNMHFYLTPAATMMPSFATRRIEFVPPDAYQATNPSITRQGDEILLVQRAVNYTIDHTIPDGDDRRYATPNGSPIHTRNFLLRLDGNFAIRSSSEILPPEDMPKPAWPLVQGFEDLRPFIWNNELWGIACLRELTPEGWCEQVLARIEDFGAGTYRLTDWRVLHPEGPRAHEKNWMPRVSGDSLQFVYLCDPTRILDDHARTVGETTPPIVADLFRGGSQVIAFDGGSLALIHETRVRDNQRYYRHRFVWLDEASSLRRVSRPFYLQKNGVEFAAGLAWHPDKTRLILTYGVEDSEAWIATVNADDVRSVLEDADRLPSGASVLEYKGRSTAFAGAAQNPPVQRSAAQFKSGPRVAAGTDSPRSVPAAGTQRTARAKEAPPPLHFIVGVPRSGTTLLRAMLGAHPSICAPSETPWLTGAYGAPPSLRELLRNLVDAGDGPVKNIRGVSPADVTRAAAVFVLELFATKMQEEGKSILVLKTPDDIWFVDDLVAFFPHAQILHLQRDVRDVALSTLGTGFPSLNHFGDNNFVNAVHRWIAWETKIEETAKRHANIHSFRFEELLAHPRAELERAARILGVPFSPRMLHYGAYLADTPTWEAGSRDLVRQTSLNPARAWAHRRVAPTAAQREVIEESAEQIEALGYPRGWQCETHSSAADRKSCTSGDTMAADTADGNSGPVVPERSRGSMAREIPLAQPRRAAAKRMNGNGVSATALADVPRASPHPPAMIEHGTLEEKFLSLAPFLKAADPPHERRRLSRDSDARIAPFLTQGYGATLPQIHCFYEVLSDKAEHHTLIAATTSMRAQGHPVRVWSYSPQKLEFLRPHGIELRAADDVMPRALFERIVGGSEIRYFSDIFRYAVLYEHGGLWMDADVIMLRPFPFRGDYFFNLQWRSGPKHEHFVCGNVMYAEPYSRHLRTLYETSIERFFDKSDWVFGMVGPKLLSDYIASEAGAELRGWVFSPVFFNSIDWTETELFDKPLAELADYLNDERLFGIHLWTARNEARAQDDGAPLVSLLTDPLTSFPSFTALADRFNTDKNRHTGNQHCYARIYDRLLSSRRLSLRRLMEIGLCRGLAEGNQTETPSVALWQSYFPFCHVIGVDLTDFSAHNNNRFTSFVCDQSKREQLRAVAAKLEPGSLDVIIDDGSHASFDQQQTLREFFPLLADGGWYFIEDLDWQPPGENASQITLTKKLLREIAQHGAARSIDPLGVSELAGQIEEILFFDSHYELDRAKLMGGLVAIRKRGEATLA